MATSMWSWLGFMFIFSIHCLWLLHSHLRTISVMRRFYLHTQVQHSGLVAQGFKTQLRSSDEAIDLESQDGHSSEVCSPIRGRESPPHMLQIFFWNRIRTQVLQGEDEWEAQLRLWIKLTCRIRCIQTMNRLGLNRCHRCPETLNVDVDSYLSQKRRTFWKKIRKLLLRLNLPLQVWGNPRRSVLFFDGNRAWAGESARMGLEYRQVSHQDHEYAKRVADTPGSFSNWGDTGNGSLVVRFEAFHTGFFESEEEKFKFQRVASTHSSAFISMDVAHPCVAK